MIKLTGRRALNGVAVLAIAATGAVWAGCGDDENEVDQVIEGAEDRVGETIEDSGLEDEAQDAVDQVEEATQDAEEGADQAAEDAQYP